MKNHMPPSTLPEQPTVYLLSTPETNHIEPKTRCLAADGGLRHLGHAGVQRQDPLARLGLELDEQLLDLAWRLLQWRPEARISAAAALRHPALSLGGVEAAAGSTGRELVMSS